MILEPLHLPVSLHHFHIDYSLYTSNYISKQFSKLDILLSGTRTSIQLKTSLLIDWYLQLLHSRTDETLPWYLTAALEELPLRIICMLSANCGDSILKACLACTGYIIFPSILSTNFSNANTCSYEFLLSFLTSCLGQFLNDEAPSARHWKIAFI